MPRKKWSYRYKKGMPDSIKGLMDKHDIGALSRLNTQKELDITCEKIGIKKGFAACSNKDPDNITTRQEREKQFKDKYIKIMDKISKNSDKVLEFETKFIALQNAYNSAKEARLNYLQEIFRNIGVDKLSKVKASHDQDDTINAWNKNKENIQGELDKLSCIALSIKTRSGKCDKKSIIEYLKKEYIDKNIDDNTDNFTKQLGLK